MKSEKVKLESVCKRVVSGGTPKSTVSDYYNGSIPWLNTKEVHFNRIYSTEKTISDDGLKNSSAKWIPSHCVIIAMYGATAGNVAINMLPLTTNQACCNLELDEEKADFRYIYYYLKYKYMDMSLLANGGAQQNLNAKIIKDFPISLPELKVQRKIASMLWSLDDKIAINNKINKNLEQQAEALFKAWFFDYLPFGGEMPPEWTNSTIEELTSLVSRGIAPKYTEDSDQVVINQKCIRDHRIDLSLARTHTPKKINEKWLQFGDLLINSTGEGTLGRTAQVWFNPEKMTVDSHVTIVRPKSKELIYYIGFWGLLHEREIESLHTGSTGQTELPRERIKAMELVLPDQTTLAKFNAIVQPMTETIINNQIQNNKLAALRDALLPKLMSGEIDVENIRV